MYTCAATHVHTIQTHIHNAHMYTHACTQVHSHSNEHTVVYNRTPHTCEHTRYTTYTHELTHTADTQSTADTDS